MVENDEEKEITGMKARDGGEGKKKPRAGARIRKHA